MSEELKTLTNKYNMIDYDKIREYDATMRKCAIGHAQFTRILFLGPFGTHLSISKQKLKDAFDYEVAGVKKDIECNRLIFPDEKENLKQEKEIIFKAAHKQFEQILTSQKRLTDEM